ncbi:hypothetical protein [Clostridium sp. AM58-1XD]|uniref:hypothetical protein n=1 Tax=Clostridium sp. AM58-1XD TaxID=2292307 RepID=UPI001FA8A3DE|nr:hypothetical protein [Clostridium sp. AM58-1XD]
MEDIKKLADKYESYIVDRRREYHKNPELSLEEVETTKRLKKDLEDMGLEVQTFPDLTGLTAVIHGGKPGKTIALRSDIDALKVKEDTAFHSLLRTAICMHVAMTTTCPCCWERQRS